MDTNQPGQRRRSIMRERASLFDELRRAIERAEDLLQATRQHVDPSCSDARAKLETVLRAARAQLARYEEGSMPVASTHYMTGEAKIFDCFNAGANK